MKIIINIIVLLFFTSSNIFCQYKKNGEPDMRYKANRSSSSYSSPSNDISVRYQNAYLKSNGTYVDGSYHTRKNATNTDNYSTKGNWNPFSGKKGSRARDYSPEAENYGNGREIHRGFFGGRYYYNDEGKKVYVPKN